MINYPKAAQAFKEYLKNYDLFDGKIKLKLVHTYGVVAASEYIAKDLNLSIEDTSLAKLIALLHDIARFEQAKQFGDFRDYETLDHAELGIKILFEDKLIRNFIEEETYDSIILKAIKNHNKLSIEEGLNERELLHAKIIRDADKMDNFRGKANDRFEDMFNSTKEKLENSTISDKIYNDFLNNKTIISSERITDMDHWVSYIAFIFDYNFNSGLKYIKEKDYINILINRINYKIEDTKNKMEIIRKHAINYIDNRLNDYYVKSKKR